MPTVTISAEALDLLRQVAEDMADLRTGWPEPAVTKLAEAIGEAREALTAAGVDVD